MDKYYQINKKKEVKNKIKLLIIFYFLLVKIYNDFQIILQV